MVLRLSERKRERVTEFVVIGLMVVGWGVGDSLATLPVRT
jgi:hypothetical protein